MKTCLKLNPSSHLCPPFFFSPISRVTHSFPPPRFSSPFASSRSGHAVRHSSRCFLTTYGCSCTHRCADNVDRLNFLAYSAPVMLVIPSVAFDLPARRASTAVINAVVNAVQFVFAAAPHISACPSSPCCHSA